MLGGWKIHGQCHFLSMQLRLYITGSCVLSCTQEHALASATMCKHAKLYMVCNLWRVYGMVPHLLPPFSSKDSCQGREAATQTPVGVGCCGGAPGMCHILGRPVAAVLLYCLLCQLSSSGILQEIASSWLPTQGGLQGPHTLLLCCLCCCGSSGAVQCRLSSLQVALCRRSTRCCCCW